MNKLLRLTIYAILATLAIFLICVFYIELLSAINLDFNFTKSGFENFFHHYSLSIKLLTSFLALLTLLIAIERLILTDKQIFRINENNKFNNYLKHRELFGEMIAKSELYRKYSNSGASELEYELITSHQFFYNKDFRTFTPEINEQVFDLTEKLDKSIEQISDDFLSNNLTIEFDTMLTWLPAFPSELRTQIAKVVQPELEQVKNYHLENGSASLARNKRLEKAQEYLIFSQFYWCVKLINSVLKFDSKKQFSLEQLDFMYESLKTKLGVNSST